MLPYWLLFTIFAAGSLQYERRDPLSRQRNPLLIAAGIFVMLMVGLRYQVGGDWGNYENVFERLRGLDLRTTMSSGDPGYSFLNWLAHYLELDVWFINLVCAAIFTWGLIKFARSQPNPWLAVLVAVPYLIIVVAMGYTRQAVAIGFVLAGLAVIERTSILRFAVYVLCAVAFHKSAIIVLPIVALSAAKNRIAIAVLLAALGAALYYVFVASAFDDLVTNYVEAEYQSQGAAIRVAMNLPPALLYLIYQKRFRLPPTQQKLWKNFSLAAIATLVALILSSSSTAVDRLALYLIPLQMFVLSRLPSVFTRTGRSNGQLVLVVLAYSALIQLVWLNKATHAIYWVPYQFYPTAEREPV
jgi:hypothetical protein